MISLEVGCCRIEGVLALKIAGSAPPSFLASRDRNEEVAVSTDGGFKVSASGDFPGISIGMFATSRASSSIPPLWLTCTPEKETPKPGGSGCRTFFGSKKSVRST